VSLRSEIERLRAGYRLSVSLGNRLFSRYLLPFVLRSSFALEEFRAGCGSRTDG